MSILLADIDATCAALGYYDGEKYHAEPDALQGLKHLIWILRRDLENHEYRRHLGRGKVLQTDLARMLPDYLENEDYCDVLIRLLVVLTSPTLLLYREGLPKDGPGRKIYLELVDILQDYKEAFTTDYIWAALAMKLHKALDTDWALRSEEEGLLIERILVLVRNVLQIPSNPYKESRTDNDASLHDQVIWALHQSGMLDLVLYVLSSSDENQYHLHALEILCLLYREQSVSSLADASLQRSMAEKYRDEQELIAIRRQEREKLISRPPPARHSRFGGTYVIRNVKSVSDKDIIFHQSLERAKVLDFDREKRKLKRSHRIVTEETSAERRSAFSVRLCLREYCIEILRSAYNTLVRQVRRVLERNSGTANHDDSYLLWAVRFFMEFNRLSDFQLHLVSESLSVQCFHWVITKIQHFLDMITSDKKHARVWGKRLHIAIETFRELLLSLLALQKLQDNEKAQALFDMLLNNVCYVLEYRETVLQLLMNYNESHNTKAYLRDVVEMANIFMKMMEKFCQNSVVVQDKRKHRKKKSKKNRSDANTAQRLGQGGENADSGPSDAGGLRDPENDSGSGGSGSGNGRKMLRNENEDLEDTWVTISTSLASILQAGELSLSEDEHPVPFDATLDKSIEDQNEDCMLRIYTYLKEEKLEHAIILLRSAREVWPDNDCFGGIGLAPEDEILLLREIFFAKLGSVASIRKELNLGAGNPQDADGHETVDEDDDEEYIETVEKDFRLEDFTKRLLNPRIIRACTIALSDWKKMSTKSLKGAVTILYRIAYECKCSAMLYQANLFRIFQKVLNAPRDAHHEELRKLAVYIMRKFTETAQTNPKIYAELLFYKTLKEANELEMGYGDNMGYGGSKGTWTEEQEMELRMLFEENQSNPQTDKDVIDWILDNLIDKTRTRRGVLKKLRELGLTFKNPTKKSLTNNKALWQYEEDEKLRSLYDQYRLDENCLQRIMEEIGDKWSKNQIIKRMIQIHLIADKSEILPAKKKRPKKRREKNQFEFLPNDETEDLQENSFYRSERAAKKNKTKKRRNKIHKDQKKNETQKKTISKKMKTPLDVPAVKFLLLQINDEFQEAINWLKESLHDAIEDAKEESASASKNNDNFDEDGIPLLPLKEIERCAMEDERFKKFLLSIGIQPPIQEMETYWRIPGYLNATDLQMRINIIDGTHTENSDEQIENVINGAGNSEKEVAGSDGNSSDSNEEDEENESTDNEVSSDNESIEENQHENDEPRENLTDTDDGLQTNILSNRRQRLNNLVFSKSDDDEKQIEEILKHKLKNKKKRKTVISEGEDEIEFIPANDKVQGKHLKNTKSIHSSNDNICQQNTSNVINDGKKKYKSIEESDGILDLDSEKNLRQRLAELTDSDSNDRSLELDEKDGDGDGYDNDKNIGNSKAKTSSHIRSCIRRSNIIDSDSSSGDEIENNDLSSNREINRNSITGTEADKNSFIIHSNKMKASKNNSHETNINQDRNRHEKKRNDISPEINISTSGQEQPYSSEAFNPKDVKHIDNSNFNNTQNPDEIDSNSDDKDSKQGKDISYKKVTKRKRRIDSIIKENDGSASDENVSEINNDDDDDENDGLRAKKKLKVNNGKTRCRIAVIEDDEEDE